MFTPFSQPAKNPKKLTLKILPFFLPFFSATICLLTVKKITDYLAEVKYELTRVTWPKKQDIARLTLTVLAISAMVGVFVGGLDFIFTKLLTVIVNR